jgi:hypothetical protein
MSSIILIVAVVAIIGVLAFVFMSKGSPSASPQQGPKPSPMSYAQIDCSKIPNKEPNFSEQTPPFYWCVQKDKLTCYDIGVSAAQKDGWFDMMDVGQTCPSNAPMCSDVGRKCGLKNIAAL